MMLLTLGLLAYAAASDAAGDCVELLQSTQSHGKTSFSPGRRVGPANEVDISTDVPVSARTNYNINGKGPVASRDKLEQCGSVFNSFNGPNLA